MILSKEISGRCQTLIRSLGPATDFYNLRLWPRISKHPIGGFENLTIPLQDKPQCPRIWHHTQEPTTFNASLDITTLTESQSKTTDHQTCNSYLKLEAPCAMQPRMCNLHKTQWTCFNFANCSTQCCCPSKVIDLKLAWSLIS